MRKEIIDKICNSNKNLIVNGDISSGKTTNVMFPLVEEMINNSESLFIIDSKEEYLNKYYEKLKENNYNIIILNLRDMVKSEGWNPLEYPYKLYKNGNVDESLDYISKLAKTIYHVSENQDPFWEMSASDLFTGLVLSLFEDGKEDEINLCSINSMFNCVDKKFGSKDLVTEYFKEKDPESKAYTFASTTLLAPKETKGGILSVARQKLRLFISRDNLNILTNKTTFKMDDIENKKTVIFFIAKDESTSLSAMAIMFIEQLYMFLVNKKLTNKFNFILDNFDSINKSDNLIDILSSCVSRKIKLCIVTRSIEDLYAKYDKYIGKLSDVIYVDSEGIKSLENNKFEVLESELKSVDIPEAKIDFNESKPVEIKTFDLQKFVINSRIKKFDLDLDIRDFNSIEDLMESIDRKIAELDSENK